MKGRYKTKRGLQSTSSQVLVHSVLIIFVLVALFPIYLMVTTSLKVSSELYKNVFALPPDPKWEHYPLIFIKRGYYGNFINSLIFAGPVTLICLVLSIFAGYGFALYRFRGREFLFIVILSALMVSEVSLLIPVYFLLKDFGLLNTHLGLILPQAALGLPFGVFLITTFFRGVPPNLLDAGRIDGCSDLRLLWSIVLPIGMPAIKALSVIQFMWAWNSYFFPLVIATKYEVMPLSVALNDFMGRFTMNYELIATTCVIMFIPIVVVYLIMQRSFARGITFGAIKG